MATDISTIEPDEIRAGDTVTWLKSLSDYPASDSWVLSYRLVSSTTHYDISSSASDSDHLVTITAATTANYTPGEYTLIGWVTKSSERYSIPSKKINVLPDLAAVATGYDIRSNARKTLDLLDAALQAQGSNAWVQEYEIAGRRMRFRSIGEFMKFYDRVKADVRSEENAERLKAGLKLKNKISVRL